MVKGEQNFINANKETIDGGDYIRCGKVNQFIRRMNIEPPNIYAMKLHQGHHYMPVKTFQSLVNALVKRIKNNQVNVI